MPTESYDGQSVRESPSNGKGSQTIVPGAVATPNMNLDTTDRILLQRLLRLAHLLHHQDDGSITNLSAATPPARNRVATSRQTDSDGTKDGEDEDEGIEDEDDEDDMYDYEEEGRPSRTGSPSLETKDPAPSQPRPHAAVEKRYRRTINEKIQLLYASIPASGKFTLDAAEQHGEGDNAGEKEQAAKPVVLVKAVDYLNHLLETHRKYDDEIQVLRERVREWLDEGDGQLSVPSQSVH